MATGGYDDLIRRLEAATGRDRELDRDIAAIVGTETSITWPRYTESLDAALSLVPEGARIREIGQWDDGGQPSGWFAHVTVWLRCWNGWHSESFTHGIQDPMDFVPKMPPLAPNPAIALCIAALRARAANVQAAHTLVTLANCPIGLFISESGNLCVKTEDGSGCIEAYVVSTGEFFWGGTSKSQDQRNVLVLPLAVRLREASHAE